MTEISTAPEVFKPSRFSFLRRTKPAIPPISSPVEETSEPEITKEQLLAKFREAGLTNEAEALEIISSKFVTLARAHGYTGTLHIAGGSVYRDFPGKDIDAILTLEGMPKGEGYTRYHQDTDRLKRYFTHFINEISPPGFRIAGTIPPEINVNSNNLDQLESPGSILLAKEGVKPIQFMDNTSGAPVSYPGRPLVLLAQTPTNG